MSTEPAPSRTARQRLSPSRLGMIDLSPLRTSAPFRRLWVGGLFGGFAHTFVTVAVLYQVWELTRNPIWTGMVGLVTAIPMIVATLIGGPLADAFDRRTIVRGSTAGHLVVAAGFVAQAALDLGSVAVILLLVAGAAMTHGLGMPARRSMMVELLPRSLVPSGVALHFVGFQASSLVGPALAGFVIARWDVTAAYAVQVAIAPILIYSVVRIPRTGRPGTSNERPGSGLASMVDGFRFVKRTPAIRGSFGVDLFATLLVMPISLFPMINDLRFGGDPQTLGFFFSALASGGVLGGLFSGLITKVDRAGAVQLWAAAIWCAALATFGLAEPLWAVLAALAIAGAADSTSVIARGALVQLAIPDSYRGRVSSLDHVVGAGGPHLGDARGGLVAGLTSAPIALASGGLLALIGIGWIAARNTALRRARLSETEQPVG